LKALAKSFGSQPPMNVTAVGVGAGSLDFPDRPNILRLFLGDHPSGAIVEETLVEIATNIDDMNPQVYPLVLDKIFAEGALDAWLTPIVMKKGRPAVTLELLCSPEKVDAMKSIIFTQTPTLGVRIREVVRSSLPREIRKVVTEYGEIEVKVATLPDGSLRAIPEFESVKKASEAKGAPFDTVYRATIKAVG
jgi:hypothetical protein